MPYKTRKPCNFPGCGTLINVGERFCAIHKREMNRRANADHYDSRWRKISKLYISKHPLCAECERAGLLTPAVEVHHVIPVAAGGSDMGKNLMALCKSCHSRISLKERQHGV